MTQLLTIEIYFRARIVYFDYSVTDLLIGGKFRDQIVSFLFNLVSTFFLKQKKAIFIFSRGQNTLLVS